MDKLQEIHEGMRWKILTHQFSSYYFFRSTLKRKLAHLKASKHMTSRVNLHVSYLVNVLLEIIN